MHMTPKKMCSVAFFGLNELIYSHLGYGTKKSQNNCLDRRACLFCILLQVFDPEVTGNDLSTTKTMSILAPPKWSIPQTPTIPTNSNIGHALRKNHHGFLLRRRFPVFPRGCSSGETVCTF